MGEIPLYTLRSSVKSASGLRGFGLDVNIYIKYREAFCTAWHCLPKTARRSKKGGEAVPHHPPPSTLHPTPNNLHPAPCSLTPTLPYTLYPTPYTPHPTPYATRRKSRLSTGVQGVGCNVPRGIACQRRRAAPGRGGTLPSSRQPSGFL